MCSIIIALCMKKKQKKKRQWCKKWLEKREKMGSHVTILRELQDEHVRDFIQYLRMDPGTFYELVAKVAPSITKQQTNMRESISAEARVEATLRFLCTGCSYTSLQYVTRISKQSLSLIIPETCKAIYEVLKDDYLQVSLYLQR